MKKDIESLVRKYKGEVPLGFVRQVLEKNNYGNLNSDDVFKIMNKVYSQVNSPINGQEFVDKVYEKIKNSRDYSKRKKRIEEMSDGQYKDFIDNILCST